MGAAGEDCGEGGEEGVVMTTVPIPPEQVIASIDAELRDLDNVIAETRKWAAECPEDFAAQLALGSLRNRRGYILEERAAAEAAVREAHEHPRPQ